MPGYHIDRITEDIKREIVAILRELKDPRISGMLTVVKVSVTNDLSYAKVYVSAMEGMEAAKASVKGLTAAQGYIRHELGRRLHLRKCPELRFIADDSIEKGFALWDKLKELEHGHFGVWLCPLPGAAAKGQVRLCEERGRHSPQVQLSF